MPQPHVPPLHWQKSTFSTGPQGECLAVAAAPDGTIRLRESDTPRIIITATRCELAALLTCLKHRYGARVHCVRARQGT